MQAKHLSLWSITLPAVCFSIATTGKELVLEEVLVTAQKREQNLQQVPIAISNFEHQQLQDMEVNNLGDLANVVPNVEIMPLPTGSTGATISIRGATSSNPAITWEPAVGLYVDGVYVAKNLGALFDVIEPQSVDILRGPQGALYGKNTVGGAVSIHSMRPSTEAGGKLEMGTGNFNYFESGVNIETGELGDIASFSLTYNKRSRDGFYDNTALPVDGGPIPADKFKSLDSQAGRFSSLFDIHDNLELRYIYDWSWTSNTPALGQVDYLGENGRDNKGALDHAVFEKSKNTGHSFHLNRQLADQLQFKSITGYRTLKYSDMNDIDGTDQPLLSSARDIDHHQFSQEFQLLGEAGDFSYVAGLYYFKDSADTSNPMSMALGPIQAEADNIYGVDTRSYAIFGQADWTATERLTLTLGGRWTQENKDAYVDHPSIWPFPPLMPYSAKASDTWTNFSPTFIASYVWTDEINSYAKVARGWKAGGFNAEAPTYEEAVRPYKEETVTSYELGMKSRWWDQRFQANIAVFYNQIKDLQTAELISPSPYSKIYNVGRLNSYGAELETLLAVSDAITLFLNYGYQHAEFDGSGTEDFVQVTYAPENKASVGMSYGRQAHYGQWRGRVDYSYTDSQFFYTTQPATDLTHSSAYGLLNARVALTEIDAGDGRSFEVGIWGKNLTDEEYRLNGIPYQIDGIDVGVNYYGDPRTYGADITYRFSRYSITWRRLADKLGGFLLISQSPSFPIMRQNNVA